MILTWVRSYQYTRTPANSDSQHLLVITVSQLTLLDVRSMKAVEETPLQTQLLTSQDFYSGLSVKGIMENVPKSFAGSVRTHRGKLFLLVREIGIRNNHGLIFYRQNPTCKWALFFTGTTVSFHKFIVAIFSLPSMLLFPTIMVLPPVTQLTFLSKLHFAKRWWERGSRS